MADQPLVDPYSINAATLTIEADDFTEQVSQVQFDPSVQTSTWRGIGGNVRRAQSAAEWTATIGIAQSLGATSLLRYSLEHEGETKTAVFTPLDGGPTVTAELIIAPGTIGGTAGSDLASSSITMAVDGKPALSAVVGP